MAIRTRTAERRTGGCVRVDRHRLPHSVIGQRCPGRNTQANRTHVKSFTTEDTEDTEPSRVAGSPSPAQIKSKLSLCVLRVLCGEAFGTGSNRSLFLTLTAKALEVSAGGLKIRLGT